MKTIQGKTTYQVEGPNFRQTFDDKKTALIVENNVKNAKNLLELLMRLEDDQTLSVNTYSEDGVLLSVNGWRTVDNSYCCAGPSSYQQTYTLDVKEILTENIYVLKKEYELIKDMHIRYISENLQSDINEAIELYMWIKTAYGL